MACSQMGTISCEVEEGWGGVLRTRSADAYLGVGQGRVYPKSFSGNQRDCCEDLFPFRDHEYIFVTEREFEDLVFRDFCVYGSVVIAPTRTGCQVAFCVSKLLKASTFPCQGIIPQTNNEPRAAPFQGSQPLFELHVNHSLNT